MATISQKKTQINKQNYNKQTEETNIWCKKAAKAQRAHTHISLGAIT